MTLEEIRRTLYVSAEIKMPRFTEDMGPRERIDALEDYLNLTAVTRADLDHARLCAHGALRAIGEEWERIQGWKMHLPNRHTQADATAAKAEIRPDLYAAMTEAKWLVDRITEQIDRLSRMGDDQVASRIYSLISGT